MWLFSSCSGGKSLTAKWQQSSEDNTKPSSRFTYQYNEKTKLFYKISNDKENLYVSLLADDPDLKRRLLISGIEIWIDSVAKGKTTQGILLVSNAVSQRQQPPMEFETNQRPGKKDAMENMLIKNMSVETIGLPYEWVDYKTYSDSLNGRHFDFSLPLKYISMKNQSPAIISLILESPVPPMKPQQGMGGAQGGGRGGMNAGGGMQGGPSMGGGGRGQGGQGGGQRPPGPSDNQMQEIKITIKKLQLATIEYIN